MTSPDGITWTARSVTAADWKSIAYGGGKFVALSYTGNSAMTSTDGVTWTTPVSVGISNDWFGIAYGNGVFAAVAQTGAAADAEGVIATLSVSASVAAPRAAIDLRIFSDFMCLTNLW